MTPHKLTPKQTRFVELYDGNGTDAARKAGYRGSDNVLAQTARRMLRKAKIRQAVDARQSKALAPIIATREARQEFWTVTMTNTAEDMRNRLKASELLGKSQADFIERRELTGKDGKPLHPEPVSITVRFVGADGHPMPNPATPSAPST